MTDTSNGATDPNSQESSQDRGLIWGDRYLDLAIRCYAGHLCNKEIIRRVWAVIGGEDRP